MSFLASFCNIKYERTFYCYEHKLIALCFLGHASLRQAATVEKILLRNQPLTPVNKNPVRNFPSKVHQYSQSILKMCGTASRVPLYVRGDGNCMFNSASVAIRGNETMSCELRVRTCIELNLNFEFYQTHFHYENFKLVYDLEEASLECAIDGEYSSIFAMQALAYVLG